MHVRKTFLLLLLASVFYQDAICQCLCEEKIREGVNLKICQPKPVALDDNYHVALSVLTTDGSEFIIMTIRFRIFAETVGSNLQISFSDNNRVISLDLVKSEKDYVSNSEICHAQFIISKSDKSILETSRLSHIRFNFTNDDIHRTFKIEENATIIKEYLACL